MSAKPSKFTAVVRKKYLGLLSEGGLGRCAAARAVGIVPQTVSAYIKDHPEFEAQRGAAELEANEQVENALFTAAISGNVTACQVWLYNRTPERWADKRSVQHSGPNGGPIEHDIDLHDLSDQELAERARDLERRSREVVVAAERITARSATAGGSGE